MQMFYTLSFQLSFIVISAITTWRNRVTGKSTIMVVDDEPDLLNLTKKFLESEGYQVHAFSDPEAARPVPSWYLT
jgi:PleD family two-component response regulator